MIGVYKYGLLPPTNEASRVRDQMRAAHRYRNTMVEIERKRRDALREVYAISRIADIETAARNAEAALDEVVSEARKARSAARSAKDAPGMVAAIKAARGARKAAVSAIRDARKSIRTDPAIVSATAEINERAHAARIAARAATETWWGTYLLVEASDEQSRKTPLYDGIGPNDPRYARWTGNARVGALLIHGLPVAEALACQDTRLQIARDTSAPKRADGSPRRVGKKDHRVLRMRVGSDGRAPIFAEWPMVYHRPLPPLGQIKNATVSVRRIGPRERWTAQITVDEPEAELGTATGVCAVDIGWRVMEHGIRACRWAGSDGSSGELLVDAQLLSRFRKVEDLRSIRDKNFDRALSALVAWKATAVSPPEWWKPITANMHAWKSQSRLASLATRWAAARFAGDELAFEAIQGWAKQDRHLWQWEADQREKTLGWRREIYRVFASELRKQYSTLVLEKFDLRTFSVLPQTGTTETAQQANARANRHLVATSELRLALVNAFRRGGTVVELDAQYTTKTCHVCGSVEAFDAAAKITHVCVNGHEWDQDDNAARNLLAQFEQSGGDENTGGARNPENPNESAPLQEKKWARAARMRAEKLAQAEVLANGSNKAAE